MGKSSAPNAPSLQTPNIMPFVENGIQSEGGNLFGNEGMFNSTSRVLSNAGQEQAGLFDQANLALQTQNQEAQDQQTAAATQNQLNQQTASFFGGLLGGIG
jgi:hypothetical protein